MFNRFAASAVFVCSLCVVGCAHTQPASSAAAGPAANSGSSGSNGAVAMASPRTSCQSDNECGDKQLCVHSQCFDITPELSECSMFRVHFDFDKANLHPEDLTKLQRVARCLKADQQLHLAITGNADERGTDEYNMSLGDKRATDVAKYLTDLGVSQSQLKTISYGKEKPLCVEHDEECWATNRRAGIRTSSAGH